MRKEMFRSFRMLLLGIMLMMSWGTMCAQTEDVINNSLLEEMTAGTVPYVLTDVALTSDAKYSMYIGKNKNSPNDFFISKGRSCGIVTTTSGGKAKKITIKWGNIATASSDKISIYAKSSAYASYTDLFSTNASTKGTLLTTLACPAANGTSTYELAADYEYIGFFPEVNNIFINSITISWDNGGGNDSDDTGVFRYPSETATVTMGEETNALPILENTYTNKNVTYASSDTNVATVGENNGRVTLVAAGETVITATLCNVDGNAITTASYMLTVLEASVSDGIYYKVISADGLVAGAKYLITCIDGAHDCIMGYQDTQTRAAMTIDMPEGETLLSDVNLITSTDDTSGAALFTLQRYNSEGSDSWVFYDEVRGGYLRLYNNSEAGLITGTSKSETTIATITFDADYNASIIFGSSSKRRLVYTPYYFTTYVTSSTIGHEVQLYRQADSSMKTFRIGTDKYTTFYSDKAFVMPYGVKGGVVTKVEEGTLTIDYRYPNGTTVPAKTGLILKGAAGQYAYTTIDDYTQKAPSDNMLYGADNVDGDGKTYVEGNNVKYYVLSKDANGQNVGFYYAEPNGAPITYQEGRAFLAVDYDSSNSNIVGALIFDDNSTGINTIYNDGKDCIYKNSSIYTLTGQCLGRNHLDHLPAGVYIVNGKKIIIK